MWLGAGHGKHSSVLTEGSGPFPRPPPILSSVGFYPIIGILCPLLFMWFVLVLYAR